MEKPLKVELEIKCPSCDCTEKKKFNIVDREHPIEWRCPECGATTELKFDNEEELRKYEIKSEHAARVPRRDQ